MFQQNSTVKMIIFVVGDDYGSFEFWLIWEFKLSLVILVWQFQLDMLFQLFFEKNLEGFR